MLVGREADLVELNAFLKASPGTARALVIEGEAGIGKTTIVNVALARAPLAGLPVLTARPSAGEAHLPYAGLGDLLSGVEEAALAELAPPQRETLEVALGRVSGTVNELTLARGLLGLLSALSEEGELLLVVDDVQWLDRPTASALTFALRRLRLRRLRVLLAARSAAGIAQEVPLGLGDWGDVRRLRVGPMSVTELGALLRERLGTHLPRPLIAGLHEASGGNPMLALELGRSGLGRAADGATLMGAVAERLRAVEPDARRAISYAAAALRPSAPLLLGAGVSREEFRAALASGVLEPRANRLSFAHPLFRSVAYELLLPDERREIHARLAEASSDPVERGHHVSGAALGHDPSAVEALEGAAAAASARGDHVAAAEFLLGANDLSLDTPSEAASERELRAASELFLAGDVRAAASLARGLVDHLPSSVLRARARHLLVLMLASGMSYEDGMIELEAALADAEADDAVRAQLRVEMSEFCLGTCRLDEAVAHARVASDLASRAGAEATAVTALSRLGFAESMLGAGVPEASRRAFARWDGSLNARTSPRMELACCCMHATRFEEAAELFEQELQAAAELGFEPVEVTARGHLAELQLRAGRWAEALANGRLALEHARQAADPQIIAACSCIAGMAEAVLGNHEQARALAATGLAGAEAVADFWWTIGGRAVLGFVALAEDDPAAAIEALGPAWALLLERRLGDLSIFPVGHVLGEALAAAGRPQDALGIAAALRACPAGDRPWCRAMASRIAALAAAAQGDYDRARNELDAALNAHAELPEPFEHARALQLAGRIERSARNWGAARAALSDALERFDALGAARWSEKAASDLARLPGRRPADGRTLTAREREVAELAASGLTNKEIASRLIVSVSTVEASLTKVYAKLAVRSRTELARRVGEMPLNL